MDSYPHPTLGLSLDQVRIIVLVVALFVLCGLPIFLIYLAYATHRERRRWRTEQEKLWQEARQKERAEQAARYRAGTPDEKHQTPHGSSPSESPRAFQPVKPRKARKHSRIGNGGAFAEGGEGSL